MGGEKLHDAFKDDKVPDYILQQMEDRKKMKASKKKYNAVNELPKLHPEPDYIIKTRPPMWDDWRLNIFRGLKENRLKMDANKLARRKCWETGQLFEDCCTAGGMFGHYKCKNEYNVFLECCNHEREVELDKMRRDMSIHNEWYWLNIYDEHGEIGKQAEWRPEESISGVFKTTIYNMVYGLKAEKNQRTPEQI